MQKSSLASKYRDEDKSSVPHGKIYPGGEALWFVSGGSGLYMVKDMHFDEEGYFYLTGTMNDSCALLYLAGGEGGHWSPNISGLLKSSFVIQLITGNSGKSRNNIRPGYLSG